MMVSSVHYQLLIITAAVNIAIGNVVSKEDSWLIKVKPVSRSVRAPVCCNNTMSCLPVDINPSVLGKDKLDLPGGIQVSFLGLVNGNANGYHYGSEEADLIITYNEKTHGLHGHAMTIDGKSFVIEYCGSQGHVWTELDARNFPESVAVVDNVHDGGTSENRVSDRAVRDTTTMVTYSVKFYYTPEFAAIVGDIEGLIDQIITETNTGYANSNVPLKMVKHCIEPATIHDEPNSFMLLKRFEKMKSTVTELRGTADVAALLVGDTDSCGVAYMNTLRSGYTVSVSKKVCAQGYYSFGHEVGHNIGLAHDPRTSRNRVFPYGHGHLIKKGRARRGLRTILAYRRHGHELRVNYYSNPDVIHPMTGTPTGLSGQSNNAAVLTKNRWALAAIGDESLSC